MNWCGFLRHGGSGVTACALIESALACALIGCTQPRPLDAPSEPGREEPLVVAEPAKETEEPQLTGDVLEEVPEEPRCPELSEIVETPQLEKFSAHGYAAKVLTVEREAAESAQCVVVAWPSRGENNAGQPTRVAEHIHAAWLVAIANTLRRVPARHAALLHRVVIDNRPTQHGIAPFDREDPVDGRDGHTIWLSEHLFLDPNHWERGIRGNYFAYHASVDDVAIHELGAEHDVFSPVLLHELGHLVMYHLIELSDELSAPVCAQTCSDKGTCAKIPIEARELPCISPYCRPFKYMVSTENWAEQYRFFYQSSKTRQLLALAAEQTTNCLQVLQDHDSDGEKEPVPPWARGLPDIAGFHPSRWDSCHGRACKPW